MVAFKKAGWCVAAQGDVEGKIMSQKSSIVRLLVSFVSVFMVGLLAAVHVLSIFVTVGVVTLSSHSGCPCLLNGPNCWKKHKQ